VGRLEVGWKKVASWSTKAAISLKRAKIDEKLPWRAYGNSPTLFRTVPFLTPYGLLFPKIGGSQPGGCEPWGFATWGLRTPNLGEEEAVINRVCV